MCDASGPACTCPACGAPNAPMGGLTKRSSAYSCRLCGWAWVVLHDGEEAERER